MNNQTIQNLETYLGEQGTNKTLVLLSSEGCHHCQDFKVYLESIQSEFSELTLIEVLVTVEDKPLFGPPVLPSIVGFEDSQRVLEGAGFPEDTSVVYNLLQSWVNDEGFQYSAG